MPEREVADRLAVAEGRARMARELHEVIAHAVSMGRVRLPGGGDAA